LQHIVPQIIDNLKNHLEGNKYSYLIRSCPPWDISYIERCIKGIVPSQSSSSKNADEDTEETADDEDYFSTFFSKKPEQPSSSKPSTSRSSTSSAKRGRDSNGNADENENTPKKSRTEPPPNAQKPPPQQQAEQSYTPPPFQQQSSHSQPQPSMRQLVPLEDAMQYNPHTICQSSIKQLVPGFQGACLVGIQDRENLFFLYWAPIKYDNKDVTPLEIARISPNNTVNHPHVAITTTDSYFMNYGNNNEGTLLKITRASNQTVRNKSPKEIEIKVLLNDPLVPSSLPTYCVFCPFDNNYVFAGFSSGNIAIGRVNNSTFQSYSLSRAASSDVGEVCYIDCFSNPTTESLTLAAAMKGGTVKIIDCSVKKTGGTCDIKALNTEIVPAPKSKADTRNEKNLDLLTPTCKFHPSGKFVLLKREKTLDVYSMEAKMTYSTNLSGVLLAHFSSSGNRLLTILDNQIATVLKVEGRNLATEYSFSISDIANKFGAPTALTVNPTTKDNTDFVLGTERGIILGVRLSK
jgi:hypothetical protein